MEGLPVQINMTTEVRDQGQKDTNTMEAAGRLIAKGDTTYLRFEEPQQEGLEPTNQTVKIQQGEMTVIRKGAVNMNQRFITGVKTEGTYQSPYGPMRMLTDTKNVRFLWDETENKGEIRLTYSLILQGQSAGEYDMRVTVKEEPQS
ncbi:DUF1934 domain-containing protein [Alteribacter natronophilus]|uniref:DUF1934 domain-containing protein n=1 Tax=Alteribacter natronophilus TaxID=2583810 RepID=UPI00110F3AFC|nr:DUF1934 domain-containing protein [Alteribacter natronophilus]TMW72126.1 DUF1934 domain-containing protein [Alteribacter natronophilus]